MLLRTRISLFVVLGVIVVSVCVGFAGYKREQLIRSQYSDEVINDQLNLWANIVDEKIEQIQDNLWLVRDNSELLTAVEERDSEAILRNGEIILDHLLSEQVADRFDVIYPDYTLAYSSQSSVFRSPIVDQVVASEAINRNLELSGIGNDRQRNTAVVVAVPLVSPTTQHVIALAVIANDILHALVEMEKVNATNTMIANRRGRLLVSSDSSLWNELSNLVDLRSINSLQTVSVGDNFYSVLVLPQVANLGNLVGRLINISDVTDHVLEQRQVSQFTITFIIVFVLLSLFGLYLYLTRSFGPLNEGVQVLNALAKGDTNVNIEHTTHNDEVGHIARAVNVYRSNLIDFNRFKLSQERQRARQQRFITREMTRLADTLDGEDKDALLAELEDLGQVVKTVGLKKSEEQYAKSSDSTESESRTMGDSDSLALVAIAFQSLSSRVQDQYDRLRKALETKEALIALRNELDIATRVQLSLLPEKLEETSSFQIHGGMWPAKEVGGDFLDYFRLDDDRVAMAIGDVSGKGVPAALFTVMTRTILRSIATHIDSPGKVLESINTFLESNNDESLFVTLFYAILDEKSGRLHYASGGHNPPVIFDKNGARMLDTTDGIVLGMFDGFEFDSAYVDLERGSRIVMYTDGITEAFDANDEEFGDQRLLETVESLPYQDAESNVHYIHEKVDEFVDDAPQFDDIACIILHYH